MKHEQAGKVRLPDEGVRLAKLCGGDIELGNLILGLDRSRGTGFEASRALLREIDGWPGTPSSQLVTTYSNGWQGSGYCESAEPVSQDWGRKYLGSNGGCAYIDLNHLELCLPEVLTAYEWVAYDHAMLRIARSAMDAANERLGDGRRLQVLVNNSDGLGNSYGSHLDFLISRRAWDNIFRWKLHHMLWLAAYQASSIVFTGQGKVGSENGAPDVRYQLSQRADFFETLSGFQTTHNRPIVNSRDEPLCGPSNSSNGLARLHCIFYDSNLLHTANFLKVGVMQIILAMLETEYINPALLLDDPVEAAGTWSHDPALQSTVRLASGRKVTATDLQLMFLEDAREFAEQGGCAGVVPYAGDILNTWEETLASLKSRDLPALTQHLDWVLKLSVLETAMGRHPGLDWNSPGIKGLDHLYSSLDPGEGIYWAYEADGAVKTLVSDEMIERCRQQPPDGTRAYTRAMLLRKAGKASVDTVDWDSMRFRERHEARWWPTYRTLYMPDPLALGRSETGELMEGGADLSEALDELCPRQIEALADQAW